MTFLSSSDKPGAVATNPNRAWDVGVLYVTTFLALYVLAPAILSHEVLHSLFTQLRSDQLVFVGLASTFGWLALLIDASRSSVTGRAFGRAIFLNLGAVLMLAVIIMFLRLYYSRPYIVLFFLMNTIICYIVQEYVARIKRHRVTFLTPQPSHLARALGAEVQISADPKQALQGADLVLVDFGQPLPPEFGRAISGAALAGVPVMHVAQYLEEKEGRVSLRHIADSHFWTSWSPPLYLYFKRLADLAAVVFVAPLALVLFAGASLAVLLTMGRPVIFRQERVSRRGLNFTIYKLRTMVPTATGDDGQTATTVSDQRVTRVGAFLRRYRLDELPQLWNVARGDMSLIGPRPEQPKLVEQYERDVPYFGLRHMVRPGISGWAQVKYGYAGTADETGHKLAYDLYYIKNLSFELDLHIFVQTIKTVLFGIGAR